MLSISSYIDRSKVETESRKGELKRHSYLPASCGIAPVCLGIAPFIIHYVYRVHLSKIAHFLRTITKGIPGQAIEEEYYRKSHNKPHVTRSAELLDIRDQEGTQISNYRSTNSNTSCDL